MPLVKGGKITADPLILVADEADIPGEGAILISAARFLGDAEALSLRAGRTAVIWPNNRDVDDLVLYLGRLAAGALGFSTLPHGRARTHAPAVWEAPGLSEEL